MDGARALAGSLTHRGIPGGMTFWKDMSRRDRWSIVREILAVVVH